MKYCYYVVLSVLDEHGNRLGAYESATTRSRKTAEKTRAALAQEITTGAFQNIPRPGEQLSADIEVHDDKTWDLLWIE